MQNFSYIGSRVFFFNCREEKGARNGNEVAHASGKCTFLQVLGAKITEEVMRRNLASFEPFTYTQEEEDK